MTLPQSKRLSGAFGAPSPLYSRVLQVTPCGYDGMRSHSASNVQGYYQSQRYAPRPSDADQMAQTKSWMAAQREREMRNYHQDPLLVAKG